MVRRNFTSATRFYPTLLQLPFINRLFPGFLTASVLEILQLSDASGGFFAGPAFEPKWYPLGLIVIAMPSAWAGGRLYERQQIHPRTPEKVMS